MLLALKKIRGAITFFQIMCFSLIRGYKETFTSTIIEVIRIQNVHKVFK